MTLPSADTSNVPAELGGGDALAEVFAPGAADTTAEGAALGVAECATLGAGVLARAFGERVTTGAEWFRSATWSKLAFTAVPPSCWACAFSRPCASSLTAIMLPVVAVTVPSSQAPRPTRNRELTCTCSRPPG